LEILSRPMHGRMKYPGVIHTSHYVADMDTYPLSVPSFIQNYATAKIIYSNKMKRIVFTQ